MSHKLYEYASWRGVNRNDRRPITVYKDAAVTEFTLDEAIRVWNKLCGWNIFVPTDYRSGAMCIIQRSTFSSTVYSYAVLNLSGSEITSAVIHMAPGGDKFIVRHELGHVLNYGDHFTKSQAQQTGQYGQANIHICDDGSNPYKGVMSYCDMGNAGFGPYDASMTERDGLRIPGIPVPNPNMTQQEPTPAPPPQPTPQPTFWQRLFGGIGTGGFNFNNFFSNLFRR